VNDPKSFSWLKALGHAVAIAAAFAAPALALSIARVVNAEKAGEFSGGFVLFGFILGWIWSYARQRAYSTVKNVLWVILVAMSAYEVFVLGAAAMTRDKQPSLSALEKHPPAMSYQGASGLTLCQQDVGLRLHAGKIDLTPAPDLAQTLSQKNPNDAVARWVYREKSGDIIVLMAAKGFDSEESLHSFAKGAAGAAEGRMTKVRDSVEWAGDHGTIVLAFRQGQARFDMRCVSATNGDLVCVQTIGSGPDRLAGLRDSLGFGSCQ
jgi:hypothetical protein